MGKKLGKVVAGTALAGVIVSGAGAGFAPLEADAASKTTKSSVDAKKVSEAKKKADAKKKAEAAKKAAEKKRAELAKKIAEAKKKAAEAKKKADAAKKAAEMKLVNAFKVKAVKQLDDLDEGLDMLIEENGYSIEYLTSNVVPDSMVPERDGLRDGFTRLEGSLNDIKKSSGAIRGKIKTASTAKDVVTLEAAIVKLSKVSETASDSSDDLNAKSEAFTDKVFKFSQEKMFNFQMSHMGDYGVMFSKIVDPVISNNVMQKITLMQKAMFDSGMTFAQINPISEDIQERVFNNYSPFGTDGSKMDAFERAVLNGKDTEAVAIMKELSLILDKSKADTLAFTDAEIKKAMEANHITVVEDPNPPNKQPVPTVDTTETGTTETGTADTGTADTGTTETGTPETATP